MVRLIGVASEVHGHIDGGEGRAERLRGFPMGLDLPQRRQVVGVGFDL
jgi:hypothetical protein